MMSKEDLECLSDVQSDSEFSPLSNSKYSFQTFFLGLLSLPHHLSCLQVECFPKVLAHLIPAAANQTQSLSTPHFRVSLAKMLLGFLKEGSALRCVGVIND